MSSYWRTVWDDICFRLFNSFQWKSNILIFLFFSKTNIVKTPKKQHEYYSEPNLLPTSEERHPLEYVTEDGVYNHLGDTEENFDSKPSSSVYDVFGHTDVEYDISMASHKRIENIGDMYDSSRGVAVYDTTHDQNINNRPESQIYNIISTRWFVIKSISKRKIFRYLTIIIGKNTDNWQ